jgi:diguanylate cyclase (GGDEF)-like protein
MDGANGEWGQLQRHRLYLIALGYGVVACSLYVLVPSPASEVVLQLASWSGLAIAWRGVRRFGATRSTWALILGGYGLSALGDLVFAIYVSVDSNPFPSFADALYLSSYLPLTLGLVLLVRHTSPGISGVALSDAGIMLTPAVVAAWMYLVAPLASTDTRMIERVVSIAYPTADLLCLAVVLRLIVALGLRSERRQPALTLLLVALLLTLLADILFVTVELRGNDYALGSWISALYLLPPILLGCAGSSPSIACVDEPTHRPASALSRRRLTLLALAALITPGLLLMRWVLDETLSIPLVVAGTSVSFLLVIARMSGLVAALERSQRTLRFDATHDQLTRLANRQLFTSELEQLLDADRPGALLFIDLDHFKAVNDTLGHRAGDDVLVEVANRLRSTIRSEDLVARLSGDEFVVLIDSGIEQEVSAIAHAVVEHLVVERPSDVGTLRVTASVGMVRWPAHTPPSRIPALLSSADRAMYGAKQNYGNQLAIDGTFGSMR